MLLLRWIAPVNQSPAGMRTRPPPAAWQASTAALIELVQSLRPSARAPWSRMSTTRDGNVGGRKRGMRNGAATPLLGTRPLPFALAIVAASTAVAAGAAMARRTG